MRHNCQRASTLLGWLVPGADPNDYDPGLDEELYHEGLQEAWRDREREDREDEEPSHW